VASRHTPLSENPAPTIDLSRKSNFNLFRYRGLLQPVA